MAKKGKESYSECKRVMAVSVAVNVFLMLYKLIVGIVGRSSAVIADGVHSLSDLLTDLVVLIGVRYAHKPEDEDHPYGHGKVETFASLVISVALIIVALGIIYGTYKKMSSGEELKTPGMIALTAVIISIILKEALFRYTYFIGRKYNLSSLIANAWHHRSDAYSSIAAMVGVVGAMMGFKLFDPVAAAAVAVLIGKAGYDIGKEAFLSLIDTAADKKIYDRIVRIIKEIDEVKSYHGLKTRTIGNKVISELKIKVDPSISVVEGHDIAEEIKARVINSIKEVENILIHVEPIGEGDTVTYLIDRGRINERRVRNCLKDISGIMGIHSLKIHHFDNDIILTVDIETDPAITVEEGHNIAKVAKRCLLELGDNIKDVVVHIDPYECED